MLVLAGMTLVKAVVLPTLVRRSAREVQVKGEIEPLIGFTLSLLAGVGLLGVGIAASRRMALSSQFASPLLVAVAIFTILTGIFLIVARKKAITQVLGYLVMENGIYSFGMAYAVHETFLVEMGILLDVWALVFIMGIAIHDIHSAFDHIDTDRLSTLKE
jgi:hydrogenase-4 component E